MRFLVPLIACSSIVLAHEDDSELPFGRFFDDETVEFMETFYRKVIEREKPAVALAMVQRELLQKYRAGKGLAAAVYFAGPFVLTSSEQ